MKRWQLVAVGAAAALATGAVLYWGMEKVTDTVEVGPSGKARANPFYAAEQVLDELGLPTDSVYRLEALPPVDHALLLLASDPSRGQADVDALWDWVYAGGHLLVVPSPPPEIPSDEEEDPEEEASEVAAEPDTGSGEAIPDLVPQDILLARASVWLYRSQGMVSPVEVIVEVPGWDQPLRAALDPGLALAVGQIGAQPGALWTDPAFVRYPVGEGLITVLADATPFDNEHMGQAQHARLLWALLQRDGAPAGALLVVEGRPPSLWSLVAKNAGLALWSGAAFLLAWLWKVSRRLGPRIPDPPRERRSLVEQMDAVGNFLWRRGQVSALLEAGRAVVSRRLARLYPSLSLLDPNEQATQLAEETGSSVASVRLALLDPLPTDAAGVLASVQALQALARPDSPPRSAS